MEQQSLKTISDKSCRVFIHLRMRHSERCSWNTFDDSHWLPSHRAVMSSVPDSAPPELWLSDCLWISSAHKLGNHQTDCLTHCPSGWISALCRKHDHLDLTTKCSHLQTLVQAKLRDRTCGQQLDYLTNGKHSPNFKGLTSKIVIHLYIGNIYYMVLSCWDKACLGMSCLHE